MYSRGFSFPELIIAVGIFALLSVATVSVYANFNNRTGVDLLAHQIAQFGREAQVSALSVKKSLGGTTDPTAYPAYGLFFDKASTTSFVFFADLNGNGKYDPSASCGSVGSECERKIQFLKGVQISAICGELKAGYDSGRCTFGHVSTNFVEPDTFSIMFKRPSPDAQIRGTKGALGPHTFYTSVIAITSAKGYSRFVQFYNTGQVTVKGDVPTP